MKRIIVLTICVLLLSNCYAQYIGWNYKKINRSVKRVCSCEFDVKSQNKDKVEIHFSENFWIIKMTFYFDNTGLCYGYSAYSKNEEHLKHFINQNYSYNEPEDFYENKRSYLFYQSNDKIKIVHILDKNASIDSNTLSENN